MTDPPLARQIAERLARRIYPGDGSWPGGLLYDARKRAADAIASDEEFKGLVTAANEKCWSCGKPMRHDEECLCHGCGHYVCACCCEEQGHYLDNAHGQALSPEPSEAAQATEPGRTST